MSGDPSTPSNSTLAIATNPDGSYTATVNTTVQISAEDMMAFIVSQLSPPAKS